MVILYWVIVSLFVTAIVSYYWIYHSEKSQHKRYKRYEEYQERIRRGDY